MIMITIAERRIDNKRCFFSKFIEQEGEKFCMI